MQTVSLRSSAGVPALRPMLPVLADLPTGAGRWSFEVKWDGVRALATVTGGRVRVRSRSGTDLTVVVPELEVPPAMLAGRSALLDGELDTVDTNGRIDFEQVTRRLGCTPPRARQLSCTAPLAFVSFDLLWLDDAPLVNAPYADRRAQLEALELTGAPWLTTPAWANGAALWDATAVQQLEGVVAKRLDSRYQPGRRSRAWIKAKHWQHATLPIIGWRSPGGRLAALHVAAAQPDGALRYAGAVEWGLTPRLRADLTGVLPMLARAHCPLTHPCAAQGVRWVEPLLSLQVRFQCWTRDGLLRTPLARGIVATAPSR